MADNANGQVLLPKWFLGFLSLLVSAVVVGVVPWASSVDGNLKSMAEGLSAIRAKVDGQAELQAAVITALSTRVDRFETRIDRMEDKLARETAAR